MECDDPVLSFLRLSIRVLRFQHSAYLERSIKGFAEELGLFGKNMTMNIPFKTTYPNLEVEASFQTGLKPALQSIIVSKVLGGVVR